MLHRLKVQDHLKLPIEKWAVGMKDLNNKNNQMIKVSFNFQNNRDYFKTDKADNQQLNQVGSQMKVDRNNSYLSNSLLQIIYNKEVIQN